MQSISAKLNKLNKTGLFHIFASSAFCKVIGFLGSVVLVRVLTKNEYGIFTYAWNIFSIIMLFNGFKVELGALQLASERNRDTGYVNSVFAYSFRFGVRVSLVLSVIVLLIGMLLPLKIEAARPILISLSLMPALLLTIDLSNIFLRSQKKCKEYAGLTLINTTLVFVLSISGALLCKEIGLVLGRYAAYILSILVGFFAFRVRFIKGTQELDRDEKKALLSISVISMCNSGLSQLLYLLDLFVLGLISADETLLASYRVATIIPTALVFIPNAFITYAYPYFAEHRRDGQWCMKHYKEALVGMGILNLAISLLMIIFAPLIIRILYGAQYLDAVYIFRLLSANYFFSGTFRIISGNLLVTQRKLRFNFMVALISGIINIIADWTFIQMWGPAGAAYATILVVLVASVLSTGYLIKVFRKPRSGND